MSNKKVQDWNKRYAESNQLFGNEANSFMVSQKQHFLPGMRALSLGDGEGFNSIWLTIQGLEVTAVDSSKEANKKSSQNAKKYQAEFSIYSDDILEFLKQDHQYDLITLFFVHLPAEQKKILHSRIISRLKPGGLFICECFHEDQLNYPSGGPRKKEMLYSEAEIMDEFRLLKHLVLEKNTGDMYEETRGIETGVTLQYLGLKNLSSQLVYE